MTVHGPSSWVDRLFHALDRGSSPAKSGQWALSPCHLPGDLDSFRVFFPTLSTFSTLISQNVLLLTAFSARLHVSTLAHWHGLTLPMLTHAAILDGLPTHICPSRYMRGTQRHTKNTKGHEEHERTRKHTKDHASTRNRRVKHTDFQSDAVCGQRRPV